MFVGHLWEIYGRQRLIEMCMKHKSSISNIKVLGHEALLIRDIDIKIFRTTPTKLISTSQTNVVINPPSLAPARFLVFLFSCSYKYASKFCFSIYIACLVLKSICGSGGYYLRALQGKGPQLIEYRPPDLTYQSPFTIFINDHLQLLRFSFPLGGLRLFDEPHSSSISQFECVYDLLINYKYLLIQGD